MKTNILYEDTCLEVLKNKKLIDDASVDLIMTSPPYANQRKSTYGGTAADKYVEWFLPISNELYRILKPRGSFILNIKEHAENGERQTYVLDLILALRQQGWLWVEEYCWYKKNSYPGKWPNRFRDSWERCLHFTKQRDFAMYQDAVKVPIGDWSKSRFKSMSEQDFVRHVSGTNAHFARNVSNWLERKEVYPHNVLVFETEHYAPTLNDYFVPTVISSATQCSNKKHSASFPLELPEWFIRLFTKNEDVVLDPFAGAGTTLEAAIVLHRRFLGIESMKEYAEIANSNIAVAQNLMKEDK